jgi:hypothetical protein
MLFKLISFVNGDVIFSRETTSMKLCLEAAVRNVANLRGASLSYANLSGASLRDADLRDADLRDADLRDADLSDADLSGADLSGADLRGASLSYASLSGASLSGASLSGANLSGANLSGANLSGANLGYANLSYANLSGASLRGASLSGANLSGANLSGANLSEIKDDLFKVLSTFPGEVHALVTALKNGRVDGSVYSGECACLIGTIANAKKCGYTLLNPDSNRPIERFLLAIRKGDTPGTNQVSKIALEWVEEWLASSLS